VFGYDFYKTCIAEGSARVADAGPGAGQPTTRVLATTWRRCAAISGLDEVSFHMSGTEAVMQAVRLARYHTRRKVPGALLRRLPRLVGRRAARPRQPAATRARPTRSRTWTPTACACCASARHRLRAGQPAAGPAPQRRAPGDSTLVDSAAGAGFDRAAYTAWLQQLRQVCTSAASC
jgi:glutamate-1-semialdehyde 2,1-aminomutase